MGFGGVEKVSLHPAAAGWLLSIFRGETPHRPPPLAGVWCWGEYIISDSDLDYASRTLRIDTVFLQEFRILIARLSVYPKMLQ